MAAIYLILLCSFLISHETFGFDYREYEGNKNSLLEKKTEIEKYWKKIKVIKRSLGNEIGEDINNFNSDLVTTTSANSIYNSNPGAENNDSVSEKQINPNANSGESLISENLQNLPSQSNTSVQGNNDNEDLNNQNSNTNGQTTDIDSNSVSGNETVNSNNESSTAISQSAISSSSNHSSEHLQEHALSSSQNESRNATTDNFATPVNSTRKSASTVPLSTTDNMANMLGGNNLNTTPPPALGERNKLNNEIPEISTQAPDSSSLTQTTSASQTFVTTNQQTTVPTQSDMIASNLTTTVKTTIESHVNSSNVPPTMAAQFSDVTSQSENNGNISNETTNAIPENSPVPTPHPETNNITATTVPTLPSTTKSPESEPLPEPESEDNSTAVVEPETTSEPVHSSNDTVSLNPKTTAKTVTNTIKPGGFNSSSSADSSNVTTTHKTISNNVTDSESSPEPTAERNDKLSNGTIGPEPSVIPEFTNSPLTNATTSEQGDNGIVEPTAEPEKASTESSTFRVTTAVENATTSKVHPEVTPEPEAEGEVTPEPEPVNNTTSETFGNTTTLSSSLSTLQPTTVPTSVITTIKVVPEPTNGPNTTAKPEPSPETSADPEPSNNVTTGSATVEPTAEPEKSSSTERTYTEDTSGSSTAEPTKKTDGEPEPEDETPESEKENVDPDSESEYDNNAFAEPGPEWKQAKEVWREAWEFHVYFFGIAFSILGFYCVVTLIRLWSLEHLLSKHYFITLHILVICVCVLRATYLMVDAYNSLGTFPFGLDYFMYSTAFPCLTASFSILFYALLLATRVRVISGKVQKLWVLVLIVSLHFLLSISTDIVVGLFTSASIMIFICQAFFILWGLLMFVGYLVLFRKLYKGAMTHQKLMMGGPNEYKHTTSHAYQVKPTKQRYTIGLAVKITFISAFFGVAIVGFELYGMFGVYGVFKFDTKPDPWPWWIYHTIVRSLEILMCLGVAYVASQPLRYKMKKDVNNRIYDYLLPCSLCCCPNRLDHNDTYSSSISLDYVVSETDHLSWLKKIRNKSPSPKAPYPPHTAEKYSDPDATLLVRKIKRTSKPSMLVVEDGFVRIRRDDENLPSNQYELDSRSSHSSDMNVGPDGQNTGVLRNVENLNYTGPSSHSVGRENMPGVNFDNYLLQGSASNHGYLNNDESADETDIDIVVTESEHESDGHDSPEGEDSGASNKSADIFRPLSMIDLAASMESELDRAFHSNGVEEADIISHNSLPPSFDRFHKESDDCAFNKELCEKYCDNSDTGPVSNLDSTNYSSDSADDQSKSSDARLMRPLVRRCKSDDSKSSSPKYKHFEKNKYFSVSSVDTIGKDEEFSTHYGSNGEMRTEL